MASNSYERHMRVRSDLDNDATSQRQRRELRTCSHKRLSLRFYAFAFSQNRTSASPRQILALVVAMTSDAIVFHELLVSWISPLEVLTLQRRFSASP